LQNVNDPYLIGTSTAGLETYIMGTHNWKIRYNYLFIIGREYYIAEASQDLYGSLSIMSVARDALELNKVLGSQGNVIFLPMFIASLLPHMNEELCNFSTFKQIL